MEPRIRDEIGAIAVVAFALLSTVALATDQGADQRGSRPIAKCPDFLYEVREGAWYGWPDFFGGRPAAPFLLANHEELPPPESPLAAVVMTPCTGALYDQALVSARA